MAKNGSWDIGCGTYAWSILKPDTQPDPGPTKVPLAVGPQSCNSESNFRGHADVTGGDVSLGAAAIWYQMPVKMTAKSPRWTPPKPPYGRSGYELKFAVEWKPGCTTEVEEQVVRDPLGDTSNLYYSLFLNNWIDCTYTSFHLDKNKSLIWIFNRQQRRGWRMDKCRLPDVFLFPMNNSEGR